MINSVKSWEIPVDPLIEENDESWEFCPEPFKDEAFLSWFTRLSINNCSDPRLLYLQLKKSSTLRKMNLEVIGKQLCSLSRSKKKQKELLSAIQPFIKEKIHDFQQPPCRMKKTKDLSEFLNVPLKFPRYCPYCLEQDEIPYFRDSWFYKPFLVCPIHHCLLFDSCPHCNAPIKFWNTSWNTDIIYCAKCGQSILTGIVGTFEIQNVDYYGLIEKVFAEFGQIHENLTKYDFFHHLWEYIRQYSRDPLIYEIIYNDMHVSREHLFRAILVALKNIIETPNRSRSIVLNINREVENKFTLEDLEISGGNLPKELDNDIVRKRINAIAPLLRIRYRTFDDVKKQAKFVGCGTKTLYNWMSNYKKDGVAGLNPQNHKSGRKPRQLPPEIELELVLSIKEFILGGENIPIKRFYEECREKAINMGLPKDGLKYNYFYKRLRQERDVFHAEIVKTKNS